MKPFPTAMLTLIASAASSAALAHELAGTPHAHPHPEWSLALGGVAIIAITAGLLHLARAARRRRVPGETERQHHDPR